MEYVETKDILGISWMHDRNKDPGKVSLLKQGKRELVKAVHGEVSRKCKDMMLYVSHKVITKEENVSEEKQVSE